MHGFQLAALTQCLSEGASSSSKRETAGCAKHTQSDSTCSAFILQFLYICLTACGWYTSSMDSVGRKKLHSLHKKSDRRVAYPLGWFFLLVIHPLSFFLLFDPTSLLPRAGQTELPLFQTRHSGSVFRLGTTRSGSVLTFPPGGNGAASYSGNLLSTLSGCGIIVERLHAMLSQRLFELRFLYW